MAWSCRAAATAVLCQCSRRIARAGGGILDADPPDIAQLETRLAAYLRPNAHPHCGTSGAGWANTCASTSASSAAAGS